MPVEDVFLTILEKSKKQTYTWARDDFCPQGDRAVFVTKFVPQEIIHLQEKQYMCLQTKRAVLLLIHWLVMVFFFQARDSLTVALQTLYSCQIILTQLYS